MQASLKAPSAFMYNLFIRPHSRDVDSRRREFILNTLLLGLGFVAIVALLDSAISFFLVHTGVHIDSVITTLVFFLGVSFLLALSRRGKAGVAAVLFAGLLLLSGIDFAVTWGFGLAEAELVFALTIVVAGVLFTAPLALIASIVISFSLLVVAYLQTNDLQHPLTYWQSQPFTAGDAVGYIAIFVIIGLVSWLSNREIDRSLRRARTSEAALQKERDNLEAKVVARTHDLEDLQLARLLEMQPFAEFGRIGASLVHEIANPLTAISLQLETLDKNQHSDLIKQVQRNLHQLERYLLAARKQLKRESRLSTFSVGAEIKQVINLATNRARKANVELVLDKATPVRLHGDAVKFNQLVANLLANAIDASRNEARQKAVVSIHVEQVDGRVVIQVTDHGVGIKPTAMEHLFEPFYSTKKSVRGGLGIGLAMVKQFVEHDFRGSIEVVSNKKSGTVFTVRLPERERR